MSIPIAVEEPVVNQVIWNAWVARGLAEDIVATRRMQVAAATAVILLALVVAYFSLVAK